MHVLREMLTVGIQGNDILVSQFPGLHEAGFERAALPPVLCVPQHYHPRVLQNRGGIVRGTIVHDQDGKPGGLGAAHHIPHRAGVVVRRNQDQGVGGGLHYWRVTVILVQRVSSARESVMSAVVSSL